jgi:hypothetical protein
LRRLIRAIVTGRSMPSPSPDTNQQLVSSSITSYSDLQFPESFVSTPWAKCSLSFTALFIDYHQQSPASPL